MFRSRHFQALKNDRSIGWHNFFHFFLYFQFFYTRPGRYNKRMLTKAYLAVPRGFSWIENYKLICQTKRSAEISVSLKFPLPQIFVTCGKFRHLRSTNILGQQKFGLFHID